MKLPHILQPRLRAQGSDGSSRVSFSVSVIHDGHFRMQRGHKFRRVRQHDSVVIHHPKIHRADHVYRTHQAILHPLQQISEIDHLEIAEFP